LVVKLNRSRNHNLEAVPETVPDQEAIVVAEAPEEVAAKTEKVANAPPKVHLQMERKLVGNDVVAAPVVDLANHLAHDEMPG
jgi:hypothetical protein